MFSCCDVYYSGNFRKKQTKRGAALRRAAAILCCLAALTVFIGCDVSKMSSLGAYSRAHAGEYECISATLGGEELIGRFRFVHLLLEKDGHFLLTAKGRSGFPLEKRGEYAYEEESGELVFFAEQGGRRLEKRCALRGGEFTIAHSFRGRELIVRFRAKI